MGTKAMGCRLGREDTRVRFRTVTILSILSIAANLSTIACAHQSYSCTRQGQSELEGLAKVVKTIPGTSEPSIASADCEDTGLASVVFGVRQETAFRHWLGRRCVGGTTKWNGSSKDLRFCDVSGHEFVIFVSDEFLGYDPEGLEAIPIRVMQ